jgi:chaperone modulatory protein CbpM
MPKQASDSLSGELIEEGPELSLEQLCRRSGMKADRIEALVEQGLIEPSGGDLSEWRFSSVCVIRVKKACRLQADLGLNTAGAALAVELMEEIELLQVRLKQFEGRG